MRQLVLDLPQGADFSAKAWLSTRGTEEAELALEQVGERCVCVYGPEGAGKSHLLAMTVARNSRVLAVDNVDELDAAAQEMLFHEFNNRGGRNLVVSSRLPVAQLSLLADVKSRLLTGAQVEMRLPEDDELVWLLEKWAASRQLVLPKAVVDFLLVRADRNPKRLLPLVTALDRLSLEEKRAVTVPLAKRVLGA